MKNASILRRVVVFFFAIVLIGTGFPDGQKDAAAAKLVLATLNSVEGKTTAIALRDYGKLKGIEVEVVEAPYSNLFEKEVLDLYSNVPSAPAILSYLLYSLRCCFS